MEYRKLKELVEINSESITKNYNETIINYLDTSNITNGKIDSVIEMNIGDAPNRAKRIVRKNDIIYSTVRPNLCHYGILRAPLKNMIVSTGFAVLRCKEEILPEYLYAYITLPSITTKLHAIAETSTSAYPSIKPKDLEELDIALPIIEIQQKIAHILSNIDKKIELNNQINDNLYKMLNILFKSWFEDFNNFKQEEFKDSEVGKIPNNFDVIELNDLINIRGGLAYKASKLSKDINDNILVSMGNVELNKLFNFNNLKHYSEDAEDRYIAEEGNLFICTRDVTQQRNQLGCPGMIPKLFGNKKIIIGTNLYIVDYKRIGKILNKYMFLLLNSLNYRERIVGSAKGTAVLMIAKDDILKFKFPFPKSEKIIYEFNTTITPLFELIENNVCENNTLEQLRDTLLLKLMNGEIDLNNIEI